MHAVGHLSRFQQSARGIKNARAAVRPPPSAPELSPPPAWGSPGSGASCVASPAGGLPCPPAAVSACFLLWGE